MKLIKLLLISFLFLFVILETDIVYSQESSGGLSNEDIQKMMNQIPNQSFTDADIARMMSNPTTDDVGNVAEFLNSIGDLGFVIFMVIFKEAMPEIYKLLPVDIKARGILEVPKDMTLDEAVKRLPGSMIEYDCSPLPESDKSLISQPFLNIPVDLPPSSTQFIPEISDAVRYSKETYESVPPVEKGANNLSHPIDKLPPFVCEFPSTDIESLKNLNTSPACYLAMTPQGAMMMNPVYRLVNKVDTRYVEYPFYVIGGIATIPIIAQVVSVVGVGEAISSAVVIIGSSGSKLVDTMSPKVIERLGVVASSIATFFAIKGKSGDKKTVYEDDQYKCIKSNEKGKDKIDCAKK